MNDTTKPLHAALDALLERVVNKAIADAAPVPAERAEAFRSDVERIAVDKMLLDLSRAHPGVVVPGVAL